MQNAETRASVDPAPSACGAPRLHRTRAHPTTRLLLIGALAVVLIASSSLLGRTRITWDDIADWGATDHINIFWTLRAPRTALAALAGAGLAIGGVTLQALLRNPLASPFTLGIASGASLGAAIAYLTGLSGFLLGVPVLTLLAFAGALLALLVIYLTARIAAGRDMTRLLLAGVCVAYMCSAGVLLVTFLADRPVTNEIVTWMMGSLGTLRPRAVFEVAALLVPALLFLLYSHRALDLLAMGEDLAASRGVDTQRTVWGCLLCVGLLTGVIVANCGPIGFVGLMAPHMTRALVGPRTAPLLIGAAFVGAAFLAVCDGLTRAVSGQYELPVGVVTNILGAAFFFALLTRRENTWA